MSSVGVMGRMVAAAPVGLVRFVPPLKAALGPVEKEEDEFKGLIRSRGVRVQFPAVDKAGPQRSEILLCWDDKRTETYLVTWTVMAPIRAYPAALAPQVIRRANEAGRLALDERSAVSHPGSLRSPHSSDGPIFLRMRDTDMSSA